MFVGVTVSSRATVAHQVAWAAGFISLGLLCDVWGSFRDGLLELHIIIIIKKVLKLNQI